MDHIPYFAKFRQSGTVIVINKMELSAVSCQPAACPTSTSPMSRYRPSSCEKCRRTRSGNYFSDCDSDRVKGRSYKRSSTRHRYVKVFAAACFVLLLGDLFTLTSAAPRKRTMARQRRSTEENSLWGNPCDYDSNSKSAMYSAKLARDVASQARNAYESTSKYKDEFALKLHSYPNFDKLLPVWNSIDWLRNFTWYREEVLPKKKVIYGEMPDEYMEELMKNIDDVLPSMYKGLKMIVAGLYSISKEGLSEDILPDPSMKHNITQSMHNVRAVLCLFNEIMRSRNLDILPLLDSEVPDMKKEEKLSYALLVYRDTLNYLEYLAQVFQKMYDVDTKSA